MASFIPQPLLLYSLLTCSLILFGTAHENYSYIQVNAITVAENMAAEIQILISCAAFWFKENPLQSQKSLQGVCGSTSFAHSWQT